MSPLSNRQRGSLLLLALLVAVFFVGYGLRFGKLTADYLSDDNLYLFQALTLLDGFYDGGTRGLIDSYLAHPPHAPLSAVIIATSFAVAGVSNWAPYLVVGTVLLTLYFWLFAQLCGPLRGPWFGLTVFFAALLPLAQGLVLELRPEYGYGVLSGVGLLLALDSSANRRLGRSALVGVVWGCAVLLKPPYFPVTAALAGFAFLAEEWLRWRSDGHLPRSAATVWRHVGVKIFVVALFSLPVLARADYYIEYVRTNAYGPHAALWALHGDLLDRAFFQFTGPAGHRHLGPWLVIVVTLLIAGGVYALVVETSAVKRRMTVLYGAMLILLAAFYVAPTSNPHLGVPLQILMLMSTAYPLSLAARRFLAGRRSTTRVLLGAAFVYGFATFGFSSSRWGHVAEPAVQDTRNLHAWAVAAIREAATAENPARLFFTFSSKLMNTHSLRWVAARDGLKVVIAENRESSAWDTQLEGMNAADLILAAESGAAGIHGWMPSTQTHAQALEYLRDPANRYVEVAAFSLATGKHYFLFRRRE